MPTETFARNGRAAPESVAPAASDDQTLRELAIKQVERVRSFKLHAFAFAVGIPVVGAIWVLTEYFEDNSWPSRFVAGDDAPGNWDPWLFWVVGVWALILAIHAYRTFAHRPPSEAEIDRELRRLKGVT